ncbi:hypothetical protein PRIPAC_91329 [Pristionchus pacificus]|nr:hypothetical protein PRIPAC_91329 [Pristionchus pacificus]
MTFRCPYEAPEMLRSIIINSCVALGSTVREREIPWFFLAIERLYNCQSSPFIFSYENMNPTEIEILENHAVPFTDKLYSDYGPFRKWKFFMFDSREECDHFLLKGMRIYRLELYPIIMKVLSERKQRLSQRNPGTCKYSI